LKLFDKDESLWEIAKRYSTTVEVVRAANDLGEGEDCRAGQMLLIPRKR
jgi:LysM repeat protein